MATGIETKSFWWVELKGSRSHVLITHSAWLIMCFSGNSFCLIIRVLVKARHRENAACDLHVVLLHVSFLAPIQALYIITAFDNELANRKLNPAQNKTNLPKLSFGEYF